MRKGVWKVNQKMIVKQCQTRVSKVALSTNWNIDINGFFFANRNSHINFPNCRILCKTQITGHPFCSLPHLESMHCYLPPRPEEGRLGVTQHNIITPGAQIFQQAANLWETRIFPHQRKLIMPLIQMQNQRERSPSTRLHSLHVNIHCHTDEFYLALFVVMCLCVSVRRPTAPS